METLELWARTLGLQRVQLGFGLSSIDSFVAETLFKECQDVAMTDSLRCEQVRFNNSFVDSLQPHTQAPSAATLISEKRMSAKSFWRN
jgi:hypothetical protein